MTQSWLRLPADRPDGDLCLLCFPHAGGGAGSFVRWTGAFPPSVTPIRVQLPGRENLSAVPPLDQVDEVIAGLLPQVRALPQPIALYGHSMGALVAFELARALRRAGAAPAHLFTSGRRAPQLAPTRQPIHHLPDDEFALALENSGGAVGFASQTPTLLKYTVPLTKADLRLCEEYVYRPEPAFPFPITVFHGLDDTVVDLAEADAWRAQTTSDFAMHTFAGDHFFHQRHRKLIAHHIADALHVRIAS
jgi:medium-chain acyl-[acyl-carrier-protein] hydrolase